jgi:hypothetical protein
MMKHRSAPARVVAWIAMICGGASMASAQVLSSPAQMAEFARDKAALETNPDLVFIPNSTASSSSSGMERPRRRHRPHWFPPTRTRLEPSPWCPA